MKNEYKFPDWLIFTFAVSIIAFGFGLAGLFIAFIVHEPGSWWRIGFFWWITVALFGLSFSLWRGEKIMKNQDRIK